MPYSMTAMVKTMKLNDVILKASSKQITWAQAAEILGFSYRSMKRWKARYQKEGLEGLWDNRLTRPSPRKTPDALLEQIKQLYRQRYYDFNVTHFHEQLTKQHGIHLSYTSVKTILQEAGLAERWPRRGVHRRRRPRRPLPGMLIHLDGSPYAWLPAFSEGLLDLLVLMDDATSEIYAMMLVPQEDTLGCMAVLKACIEKQGLFCSLYSDRASHFFYTPEAGGKVQSGHLTQIGRALKTLGIQMIASYCPQGRGRSERMNRTLQGRLPQAFRLAGVKTLEAANQFLDEVYLPEHNRAFQVSAPQAGTAFVPILPEIDLNQIFSIQTERTVAPDNTVSFEGKQLQIEPSPLRISFVKCRVTVHQHLDQGLSITYGPHCLGGYDAQGKLLRVSQKQRAA